MQARELTKADLDSLLAALSSCITQRKRRLLPRILREWNSIDLPEHLSRSTPKQIRDERKRLESLARHARELAQSLSDLGPRCRSTVARRLLAETTVQGFSWARFRAVQRLDARLAACPSRLAQLTDAAQKAAETRRPLPVVYKTLVRYLILQDLAAIF